METPAKHLEQLTWQEAAAVLRQRPVGLLPVGAIEAHGPHLPLDTDVIIAQATAERAAHQLADLNVPAIVLPAIRYSVSFAGTSFPGTTPVDRNEFHGYLTSCLTQLAVQGYRAIVVCNAHLEPAHVDAVQASCEQVTATVKIPVFAPDQRQPEHAHQLGSEFQAGARHAGSYETSIVLAVKPEAVRRELLDDLEPVWIDLPARLRAGARTFADAGASLGYFGDPRASSADEGERHLDTLAAIIIERCRAAGIL